MTMRTINPTAMPRICLLIDDRIIRGRFSQRSAIAIGDNVEPAPILQWAAAGCKDAGLIQGDTAERRRQRAPPGRDPVRAGDSARTDQTLASRFAGTTGPSTLGKNNVDSSLIRTEARSVC